MRQTPKIIKLPSNHFMVLPREEHANDSIEGYLGLVYNQDGKITNLRCVDGFYEEDLIFVAEHFPRHPV